MSGSLSTINEPDADFDAIEQAVMETERGRSFLKEFARRNRHADTQVLLTSLSRIEKSIALRETSSAMDEFRTDIIEMADVIARSRQEIASLQPESGSAGPLGEASDHLENIAFQTEAATSAILAAAESIQETAWTLRETGADERHCTTLDDLATVIYTSCSSQDVTFQRTRKIISTLNFLETRLTALADICGIHTTSQRPVGEHHAVAQRMSQEDVDFVLVDQAQHADDGEADAKPLPPVYFSALQETQETDAQVATLAPSIGQPSPEVPPSSGLVGADDLLFDDEAARDAAPAPKAPSPLAIVKSEPPVAPQPRFGIAEAVMPAGSLDKMRSGVILSADEAAAALDALKSMSVEQRSHLFS
jgi:hypothetical protein